MLSGEGSVSERLERFMDYTIMDVKRMLSLIPLAYEFYALAFRQEAVRQSIKGYFKRYVEFLEPVWLTGKKCIERSEILNTMVGWLLNLFTSDLETFGSH